MSRTRRSLLAGVATGAVVGATGCLGGDSTASAAFDCEGVSAPEPDSTYRPAIGDADAPIRIQVFEDFTCSHCATFATEELPTLRSGPLGAEDVRYEHWDFPIPVDEEWALADLQAETYADVVAADRATGVERGVSGTPTVIVNDESVVPTADAITTAIEARR